MSRVSIALVLVLVSGWSWAQSSDYSIQAIRYADSPGDRVASLVMGAPEDETLDTVYAVWLIRGNGRNILFDSGFYRERWFESWPVEDYMRPDDAVREAGVAPEDVTDVIISHAHWDHMGGIDLFRNATVWIQEDEYRYYTADAWLPGGNHDGIDPEDVAELVRINTQGRLQLVDGDDQEIIPGIHIYTGARHTYASQYLKVDGDPVCVLTSDNVYLQRNLTERAASATFVKSDHAANIEAQARIMKMAGPSACIVTGHDASQFDRFPVSGRIANIRQ